ncbi:MAG: hypothetical protein FJ119_01610 [Deltaproteobacteria bacterium]|nr:hypothetical protein [Deltaproteobacteria bacterium]
MRPAIKKILNGLGTLATLASVFYLLATLARNADRIDFAFSPALPAAAALFCLTHGIQAVIIAALLDTRVPYRNLLRINSAAQIYKYLPGNIAHFFSRWMQLGRHGVKSPENARLIVFETLLLVVTYLLFGCVFFMTCGREFAQALPGGRLVLPAVAVCAAAGVWAAVKKRALALQARHLAVIALYSCSALLFGVILCILNTYMVPAINGIGFAQYTAGFAVAYLAGFVVPGSPGGIGIREVVFVEIFRQAGHDVFLLTKLIILFRLAAIGAELLMYCLTTVAVRNRP